MWHAIYGLLFDPLYADRESFLYSLHAVHGLVPVQKSNATHFGFLVQASSHV